MIALQSTSEVNGLINHCFLIAVPSSSVALSSDSSFSLPSMQLCARLLRDPCFFLFSFWGLDNAEVLFDGLSGTPFGNVLEGHLSAFLSDLKVSYLLAC